LTIVEVAEELAASTATVYKLVERGALVRAFGADFFGRALAADSAAAA
jgi:hypothetical protein